MHGRSFLTDRSSGLFLIVQSNVLLLIDYFDIDRVLLISNVVMIIYAGVLSVFLEHDVCRLSYRSTQLTKIICICTNIMHTLVLLFALRVLRNWFFPI